MADKRRTVTDADVRELSRVLAVDKQSILRRLLGLKVRGRVAQRIDAELAKRGLITNATCQAA